MKAMPMPTPMDVRLMNALASMMFLGLIAALLFAAHSWVSRLSLFA